MHVYAVYQSGMGSHVYIRRCMLSRGAHRYFLFADPGSDIPACAFATSGSGKVCPAADCVDSAMLIPSGSDQRLYLMETASFGAALSVLTTSMTDRRLDPRISDAELVMLSWEENGATLRQLGSIENLSLNGAGMIVNDALPIGSTIAMTYGEGELTAVVRHCAALGEGHFLGIEFIGSSRDSTLHFQPDLLV